MLSPEALRQELAAITRSTRRPFNVNFFCHPAPTLDPARETAWREALRSYYEELGLEMSGQAPAPARAPFSAELVEILSEFEPPVVSFHFGLPSPDLLERVRSWGAKILSTATTVDEARWLETRGVDAIIAQGLEAGGHRGMFLTDDLTTQIGTLALVPQIVRAVTVPVVAAGGIADAAGVDAAMALGAAGAQVGTAYLLCPEATTSAVHRAALKSAAPHTALTNVFTGRPARAIVNRLVREVGPVSRLAPPFPLAAAAVLPLRAQAEARGSDQFSPLWSGTNATGCKEVPAADLTRELASRLAIH
jgi:nitronate monooxygenase